MSDQRQQGGAGIDPAVGRVVFGALRDLAAQHERQANPACYGNLQRAMVMLPESWSTFEPLATLVAALASEVRLGLLDDAGVAEQADDEGGGST